MAQEIQDSDYNAIRKKIIAVMGSGGIDPATDLSDAKFGYGQLIVSADVEKGQIVTSEQWNALRFDIFNARIHQEGTRPLVNPATVGQTIRFDEGPLVDFNNQTNIAITNKFNIGTGQFVIDQGINRVYSTPWKNTVSASATVTFASVNQARWFFNSGSKLRIYSTRLLGSTTAQNTEWTRMLNSVGTVEFGGITSPVGFYSLTNVDQILKSVSASSPYSGNNFSIRVRSNVADNSNGGATQIIFSFTWTDGYTDPPGGNPGQFPPEDGVDGNLEFTIEEQRASGLLEPTGFGAFVISSPAYSSSGFLGS
jgi:hypothetical protein